MSAMLLEQTEKGCLRFTTDLNAAVGRLVCFIMRSRARILRLYSTASVHPLPLCLQGVKLLRQLVEDTLPFFVHTLQRLPAPAQSRDECDTCIVQYNIIVSK